MLLCFDSVWLGHYYLQSMSELASLEVRRFKKKTWKRAYWFWVVLWDWISARRCYLFETLCSVGYADRTWKRNPKKNKKTKINKHLTLIPFNANLGCVHGVILIGRGNRYRKSNSKTLSHKYLLDKSYRLNIRID